MGLSIEEAEIGGSLWVRGQPELQSETFSKKKKKRKETKPLWAFDQVTVDF